jgi:hypothetical protein
MATRAVLQVGLALEDAPANIDADLDACYPSRTLTLKYLERLFGHVVAQKHKLSVRVDSVTDGATQYPLDRASPTITITYANITAGETIVIGNVTLTWAASAANENEVTIGANLAADTTNLTSAINVHSKLKGMFTASGVTATGVVTVTYCGDPRLGYHIGLSETGDAVAVSGSNFALDTTDVYASASITVRKGL